MIIYLIPRSLNDFHNVGHVILFPNRFNRWKKRVFPSAFKHAENLWLVYPSLLNYVTYFRHTHLHFTFISIKYYQSYT